MSNRIILKMLGVLIGCAVILPFYVCLAGVGGRMLA